MVQVKFTFENGTSSVKLTPANVRDKSLLSLFLYDNGASKLDVKASADVDGAVTITTIVDKDVEGKE